MAKKDEMDPEEIKKATSTLQQASLKLFEMAYKKSIPFPYKLLSAATVASREEDCLTLPVILPSLVASCAQTSAKSMGTQS
ncbi:hypothetical protein J437_LFUL014082 [Ladona fulva]|uniref:Uncharacterized protein n=1 Tax=Ladona fulva TaxID=123851 RepID=A0A8K0KN62_LADFU|nr:hypothetical protein J437_LFUL014082 [Ladona fulva]